MKRKKNNSNAIVRACIVGVAVLLQAGWLLTVILLLNEYDWERSPDCHTTWRIGDGTAPFYNYIYYRVAGFTENDTLRSNQIREGMLSREKALEYVYRDNAPRYESMKWYLDTVKLDMADVLEKVSQIKPIYQR